MSKRSSAIPSELAELGRYGCSLVILRDGCEPVIRSGRGVADLYELYESGQRFPGATVVDKVVGAGAAVLMVALGITRCITPVASCSAMAVFGRHGVEAVPLDVVDNIINRAGTGRCPVEILLDGCSDLQEMIERIKSFLESRK